jgi:hypothetical protein
VPRHPSFLSNNNSGQLKYIFYFSLSFSLSLAGEEGVHTLFTGQREREREKERGGEREREREREREKELTCSPSKCSSK